VLQLCGAAVLRYSGDLQFAICNLPFGKLKALSLPKGDFQIVNPCLSADRGNRKSKMKDSSTATQQHLLGLVFK
jgi:hypothetical protein